MNQHSAKREQLVRLHRRSVLTALYDDFAPTYEHDVSALCYRTAELIKMALVRTLADNEQRALSTTVAIDLGCGTGLCGAALRDRCVGHLVGCDLSHGMLSVAQSKTFQAAGDSGRRSPMYDELLECDAVACLCRRGAAAADLVFAADVLVYMEALDDLFAAVATGLAPNGLFAFSTEAAEDDECAGRGWILREATERTAHSAPYLRRLVSQHGLSLLSLEDATLRVDGGQSVPGHIIVAQQRRGSGLLDLPADLLFEIALRSPIKALRLVVRFDARL